MTKQAGQEKGPCLTGRAELENTTGQKIPPGAKKLPLFVKIAQKFMFFEATSRQNANFSTKLLKNAPF